MDMFKKFNYLFKSVLVLPRYAKQTIAITSDAALCVICLWIAFFLRIDQFVSLQGNIIWAAVFSISLVIPIFWLFGLYRTVFRYSGKSVIVSIGFAHVIYALLYMIIVTIIVIPGVPRSIGLLQPLVLFFAISGSRLCVRYLIGSITTSKALKSSLPRALIYGAGSAGRQLFSALENSNEMKVAGFIDDDKILQGQVLLGLDIYAPENLKKIIESNRITHVLLALPSVNRIKRTQILKKLKEFKVVVRTLPTVTSLVEGKVTVSDIRELEVEDILGRDPVIPNNNLLTKNITSKIVLVTGAGGSIGSELCRQIISLNPKKLILVEISEYALYQIQTELEDLNYKISINPEEKVEIYSLLGSAQDEIRMTEILSTFKPDTLYHAAAYKHVPLVEENICEGVKNNVFGTLVTGKIAILNNVKNFVFISSDKAVRPTNVMGASKRLAELCLKALFENSSQTTTKMCMVRFGNVLGSSGSIIPKFKKQIRDGGPVTLTHPEVTRFFMTIPEASQLVIQAGAMAEGSDVFVLDMGEPVKIQDLITRIINLSGLSIQNEDNLDGDISVNVIGLRPGEKLYEELLIGDNPQPTLHPKIKKAQDPFIPWSKLDTHLKDLEKFINENNPKEIINLLEKIVSGYNASEKIVDRVYNIKSNENNESKKSLFNIVKLKKNKK